MKLSTPQVRILRAECNRNLEADINEWLTDQTHKAFTTGSVFKLIDIKYLMSNEHFHVTILFERYKEYEI